MTEHKGPKPGAKVEIAPIRKGYVPAPGLVNEGYVPGTSKEQAGYVAPASTAPRPPSGTGSFNPPAKQPDKK